MSEKIKLVQGDTKPNILVSITDETTGLAIDVSFATTKMRLRAAGSTVVKEVIPGTPITGIVLADGTVSTVAPYNVAGAGGRVSFTWTATALDTAGDFEGEVEVTFSDTTVQTVYELLKFKVRPQF